MITKREYFKINANELRGANQFTDLPNQVYIGLTLLGGGPGQSAASVFSEIENDIKGGYTEKADSDLNGYAVYKDVPISEGDEDTSLYVPNLQKNNPYFVDCSGQNGVDQTCDIEFPYKGVLHVNVTIAPKYLIQSDKILGESERFLDSIYCNSLPSSKP